MRERAVARNVCCAPPKLGQDLAVLDVPGWPVQGVQRRQRQVLRQRRRTETAATAAMGRGNRCSSGGAVSGDCAEGAQLAKGGRVLGQVAGAVLHQCEEGVLCVDDPLDLLLSGRQRLLISGRGVGIFGRLPRLPIPDFRRRFIFCEMPHAAMLGHCAGVRVVVYSQQLAV